ncbi:MAG: hypothetical protein ABI408_00585 [Gemmatimonadaceae bacterium]
MVRLHSTLLAAAIGIAIVSTSAGAQRGSSSSLTHTVTVTVPPRVKVQIGALAYSNASTVRIGNLDASTQGLAVSINGTQAWILSIGSGGASHAGNPSVRWSLDATSGYSKLGSENVAVVSGTSTTPKAAKLFFRNTTQASAPESDANQAPVMLTVSAP